MLDIDKLRELTGSHGGLARGQGMVTGVIALSLGILCFLGVLVFHFPQYLSTPELRKSYDVNVMRYVLLVAMVVAGGLALVNIVFNRTRWLSSFAFLLVALAALLGGHKVDVDPNFPDGTPYIGLDWFILDLLGSSLIFIFIEKLFAHRKDQPIFRAEWQTDFQHFVVNHMIVGFVLLATNLMVHRFFGWAAHDGIRGWIANLPFWAGVLLIILVAALRAWLQCPNTGGMGSRSLSAGCCNARPSWLIWCSMRPLGRIGPGHSDAIQCTACGRWSLVAGKRE